MIFLSTPLCFQRLCCAFTAQPFNLAHYSPGTLSIQLHQHHSVIKFPVEVNIKAGWCGSALNFPGPHAESQKQIIHSLREKRTDSQGAETSRCMRGVNKVRAPGCVLMDQMSYSPNLCAAGTKTPSTHPPFQPSSLTQPPPSTKGSATFLFFLFFFSCNSVVRSELPPRVDADWLGIFNEAPYSAR